MRNILFKAEKTNLIVVYFKENYNQGAMYYMVFKGKCKKINKYSVSIQI